MNSIIKTVTHMGHKQFSHPLRVNIIQDGDTFLAKNNEFEQVYGTGKTINGALNDFVIGLREMYEDLFDPGVIYSQEWQVVKDSLKKLLG